MAETTAMTTSNPLGSVNLAACGCLWSPVFQPFNLYPGFKPDPLGSSQPRLPPRRTIFLWIQKVGLESHGWPLKKSFPLWKWRCSKQVFGCCKTPSACLPSSLTPRERSGFQRDFRVAQKTFLGALGFSRCHKKNAPFGTIPYEQTEKWLFLCENVLIGALQGGVSFLILAL